MFICTNCRRPYPAEGAPYQCPVCGGLYDYAETLPYDLAQVEPREPGIWRYRVAFGLPEAAPAISLGEGSTPLVEAESPAGKVFFKLEFLNPSGSFKDRGSAVIASFLKSRGVTQAVEDSSGNAGASFAAYAARAGIQAQVYVPEAAAGPKRLQIAAYGAQVIPVPGPRSNAAEAVREAARQGVAYGSHAYLPMNLAGYATLTYEIAAQIGQAPGSLVLPAGQGGLLLGAWRGFQALQAAGQIQDLPRLVGVQAMACAPLWALHTYGPNGLMWVSEGETLAEGVRVSFPLRGDEVIRAVTESKGRFIAVDEKAILPGRDALAQRGFYVEPTSALVWDALQQLAGKLPKPVVAVLTGSGLKYQVQA